MDEEALYAVLTSGHLGGFSGEVMETKPSVKSKPFDLPNVVVTPHIGGNTHEAQQRIGLRLVQEVKKIIALRATQSVTPSPASAAGLFPEDHTLTRYQCTAGRWIDRRLAARAGVYPEDECKWLGGLGRQRGYLIN